jgi:hypothetical protein
LLPSNRNTAGQSRGRLFAPRKVETSALFTRRSLLVRTAMVAVVAMAGLICAVPGHAENTRALDIEVRNGKVVGKNSVRVSRGDTVILSWSSDKRLDLHLHGYDVQTSVIPGMRAQMRIRAHATGRFPVEIHGQGGSAGGHGHKAIFHLEVYPD